MTQPRKPRPYDAIERRLHDLEAAKARHHNLTRIARLEREVAALPDPRQPSAYEMSSRASNARIDAILTGLTRMEAACEPD